MGQAFDTRSLELAFRVDEAPDRPVPGHEFRVVEVLASPYGFRIGYRIDPALTWPWAPIAEAEDDLGNAWTFLGGAYSDEEDELGPYTDGVLTTGPTHPAPGREYRVTLALDEEVDVVLAVEVDEEVPW